ncbi:helix-turn-helix domain-containing protein [Streptomyces sp. NPDC048595]|uniref:helix-turn-helix domain-containing protein n=1 Tax=Streptomyces sp. NPDC048595 TaxID=3365576 RepID=UPI003713BD7A
MRSARPSARSPNPGRGHAGVRSSGQGSPPVRGPRPRDLRQGGGLTAERQEFRERLRLQAAERFARGEESALIAKDLRVNVRSVQRWRQTWNKGGWRGSGQEAYESQKMTPANPIAPRVIPAMADHRRPVPFRA